ncbi:hypothetical protein QQS21_004592 [Conoideocrella luteorostrata]|uniref:Major facilitator superfamily (MFS) profile domain-containing protein n=1 Tax=Conoideocrella luteorostrata TaxID=1105319 RepID=A0AAJ0CTZ9_9HYPO|nr:hypothetical protein QQS21_004592 [Conoideocrella luteorostrata]
MSSQSMPIRAAASRDVEREADDYFGDVFNEDTPLLNTDLPADVVPSKSFQHLVVSMCVLFLFIVEVSQFMMAPPMAQVMEDRICGEIYPDHELGAVANPDDRCKDKVVQKELAMLRSWEITCEMLFLRSPKVFSVWSILYGNIAFLIGGGGQMAAAMIWTLISDAIPVDKRTSVFYLLYATILILAVVINPISAFLLTINAWIPLWLGFGVLVTGILSSLLVPETLSFRQKADSQRPQRAGLGGPTNMPTTPPKTWIQRAMFTAKNDMSHIWRFIFASKSVMTLILAYTLSYGVKLNTIANLLQYMTKRFDWKWSTATYISTVSNITALVVLLAILPVGSWMLVNKRGYGPVGRDLLLSRISVLFVIGGSLLTAFAPVPWLFITSLIITNLGTGFSTLCRALLNAIVEPHTVATLNTTVSMMEAIMGLISSPILGWLLSEGIDLGGPWMGLPFLVCGGLALLAGMLIVAFRLPRGFAQAD